MTHKGKILITDEGQYDLGAATWDDDQFSDVLIKTNPIGRDAALAGSHARKLTRSNPKPSRCPCWSRLSKQNSTSLA